MEPETCKANLNYENCILSILSLRAVLVGFLQLDTIYSNLIRETSVEKMPPSEMVCGDIFLISD